MKDANINRQSLYIIIKGCIISNKTSGEMKNVDYNKWRDAVSPYRPPFPTSTTGF